MAVKLDIIKAFDKGFDTKFVGWVDEVLKSAMLSILINDSPRGYFHSERGVR